MNVFEPELILGNRRGEVVRNDDPDQAGRVKVRVFGVYDDLPVDVIPWAIYTDPFMGGIENVGGIIVPEVGAHVWVFFEGGDPHLPVYWAGAPAKSNNKPDIPEESSNGYPHNKVFKTKAGFVIEIDDTEEQTRLRVKEPSGNENTSDHEGNVDSVVQGTLTIDVEGKATIRAPEIQLGEDGDVEPVVLGDQLANFFETVLKPYIDGHVHGNGISGNTTTPVEPLSLGGAAKSGSVYSKKNSSQ